MKKIYLLGLLFAFTGSVFAQVPNADMEGWRSSTTGGGFGIPLPHTSVPIDVPWMWYGSDSIIISLGQTYGSLALGTHDSDWRRQVFKETASTYVHGGSASAKIMTRKEATFRIPGVISNAIPNVGFTLSPPGITSVKLTGGSPISAKPTSVSAWVQYYAGKDSATGATGIDSGSLTVQALGHLGGKDSVIGMGFVTIAPTSTWVQITANLVYIDTTVAVDTFRIAFSSSNRPFGLDSSTLYVDDITMTTVPNPDHTGVKNATANGVVKVYPNPSSGIIYLDAAQAGFTFALYDVNGKLQASKKINGNDEVNVSSLPAGLYLYNISDMEGTSIQKGKITLSK